MRAGDPGAQRQPAEVTARVTSNRSVTKRCRPETHLRDDEGPLGGKTEGGEEGLSSLRVRPRGMSVVSTSRDAVADLGS
jgi:hypothetical protein